MTAHYLSHDVYPVQHGDTVLVHAGAGGVGLLLTQMVRARGGRVIATVSTDEKADLSRAAGAGETIPYEGFRERVRELTGGDGVAAVYDGVGKDTFDESLESLRVRGTLALYGASSGAVPPVDPRRLMAGGSLILTRPSLPHFTRTREELLARSGGRAHRRRRRIARGAHRRHLSARRRAQGPGRPAGAPHDRQAAADGAVARRPVE